MKILGYSERGIINALFYEIRYSASAEMLLENLLSQARFPFIDRAAFPVADAEILIEQSFSDFGVVDALLLINTGETAISVFVEAKVKPLQQALWSIDKEFQRFATGAGVKVDSSNLFTQLYHKVRMTTSLRKGGMAALREGVRFPKSSSKQRRKIGKNRVVLSAVEKLTGYLAETYYLAILPEQPVVLERSFRNELINWVPPADFLDWDVCCYGYLSWSDVEVFCTENELENTLQVFKFNQGQIYAE